MNFFSMDATIPTQFLYDLATLKILDESTNYDTPHYPFPFILDQVILLRYMYSPHYSVSRTYIDPIYPHYLWKLSRLLPKSKLLLLSAVLISTVLIQVKGI
jgi:hypothetical protein